MKTFILLAHVLASGDVYVLDHALSGADCIAAIETAPRYVMAEPAFDCENCSELLLDLSGAVLACEEEKG